MIGCTKMPCPLPHNHYCCSLPSPAHLYMPHLYSHCLHTIICVMLQRWADWEIFQTDSSPDPIKLNPIQSWSAKFLEMISPIQSWSANAKSCIFILPHEANYYWSYFAFSQIWSTEKKIVQQCFCLMRLLRCLSLCNTQAPVVNLIHTVLCDVEGVTQARGC